jgi:hypothetical protein
MVDKTRIRKPATAETKWLQGTGYIEEADIHNGKYPKKALFEFLSLT